jgi:hypothetical protein
LPVYQEFSAGNNYLALKLLFIWLTLLIAGPCRATH